MATARHHEELDCWRLSEELRLEVEAVLATEPASKDFEFCDQIRGSSSSTPANIAEGFARYRPRPFAYCLRTALGELGETQNHLRKGRTKQYLSEDAFARLWRLSKRAFGATTKLHRYLIGCGDNYPDYTHDPPKRTKNREP